MRCLVPATLDPITVTLVELSRGPSHYHSWKHIACGDVTSPASSSHLGVDLSAAMRTLSCAHTWLRRDGHITHMCTAPRRIVWCGGRCAQHCSRAAAHIRSITFRHHATHGRHTTLAAIYTRCQANPRGETVRWRCIGHAACGWYTYRIRPLDCESPSRGAAWLCLAQLHAPASRSPRFRYA